MSTSTETNTNLPRIGELVFFHGRHMHAAWAIVLKHGCASTDRGHACINSGKGGCITVELQDGMFAGNVVHAPVNKIDS